MATRPGGHLCALGAGKLELLCCSFPSALTHFPALEFVFSPCKLFHGSAEPGIIRSHPIPMATAASQGRELHSATNNLSAAPSLRWVCAWVLLLALSWSLFSPPPFFPKFTSQQNSQSGQSLFPWTEQ